jgi:hypothetical protein
VGFVVLPFSVSRRRCISHEAFFVLHTTAVTSLGRPGLSLTMLWAEAIADLLRYDTWYEHSHDTLWSRNNP